jgi:hypothetical protein
MADTNLLTTTYLSSVRAICTRAVAVDGVLEDQLLVTSCDDKKTADKRRCVNTLVRLLYCRCRRVLFSY